MDAMETKLFRKLDDDEKNDEFIAVESRTFLQSVWHDFTGNKRAVAGAIILIIVVLMAIFGPMMCKYSYAEQQVPAWIIGLVLIEWEETFLYESYSVQGSA